MLEWNRWEVVLACIICDAGKLSFLKCVGEAYGPVWAVMSVMRLRDFNKMPLIIPS